MNASDERSASELPADAVVVARVLGAWGIQGWIRLMTFSGDASVLRAVDRWWIRNSSGQTSVVKRIEAKLHGGDLVARLDGVVDRSAAEALKGCEILVARSSFPATDQDEFYWVDLVGCDVVGTDGHAYGLVGEVMDNGAHAILVVRGVGSDGTAREELIPFVGVHVVSVDIAAKQVLVDWLTPA